MFFASANWAEAVMASLVVCGGILSVSATAQAADQYGAIAFSQISGGHGYSIDYRTRSTAEAVAIAECRQFGSGCRIAAWFKNGCAALAVGAGNGWGAEWGYTRDEAERLAMQRCSNLTRRCEVKRWVCTAQ